MNFFRFFVVGTFRGLSVIIRSDSGVVPGVVCVCSQSYNIIVSNNGISMKGFGKHVVVRF